MAAFRKAIALDVDVIEADVQMTLDGIPIIRHDKLLDRTTNTSGYTWDFTWKEFESNIRLKNGEKVSSLEAFCQEIRDKKQQLYLDLKTYGDEDVILKTCLKHLRKDQFYIGSFHNHSIKLIKQIDPEVQTIMIIEGNPIHIEKVISNTNCDVVAMGFDSIEEDSIQVAQEMGKKVFVWTVNDAREIRRAKDMGVNGITSDFPDRI